MRIIKPKKIENNGPISLESPREVYPHFSIPIEHLPEAKKWDIGKTYYVTLELRQSDMSMHKSKRAEFGHVGFDITGIEVTKGSKSKKELPDIE